MTSTDLLSVALLVGGVITALLLALAGLALINRLWTRALDASARHIETCMTRALQIPLHNYAAINGDLEEEHRHLLANESKQN